MRTDRTIKRVLVIQQYFYPDISAVSQLLGDLLKSTMDRTQYHFTVLSGSVVRNFEPEFQETEEWPETLADIEIVRLKTAPKKKNSLYHRSFEFIAYYIRSWFYLKKHKHKYDIYISMTTPPLIGFIVSWALGRKHKPFIYYVEDLYPELLFDMGYIKKYWIIRRLIFLNKYIIHSADKIITLGSCMTKKFYYNYGLQGEKVVEIPNWTTGIHYQEPDMSGHFRILYSGNVGLAHDFTMLESLLSGIRDRGLTVEIHFVGSGRQLSSVQQIVQSSGVKCRFMGYSDRSSHNAVLAAANMFLISQKNETIGDILPSKFYSYVAAGRPMLLLGSDISEIGKFLNEHNTGRILEVEADIESVLDYIQGCIDNPQMYASACKKQRDLYAQDMGLEISVDKFINVLDEVCLEKK